MLMSGRIIPAIGEPIAPAGHSLLLKGTVLLFPTLSFDGGLELSCHLWVCLLAYRLGIKVYLNLTCNLGPN